MATPWDDSFKILLSENPQDFVSLVMPEAQFQDKLLTEFAGRKATADGLLAITVQGKPALLHIEVQSTNELDMPERILDYALRAKREHQRDVYSCVIYLREQGEVPPSPLQWPEVNGHATLTFHYLVLEVYNMKPQEVRHLGLPGLLPLLLLTKGGATREIAEEVVSGLEATGRHKTLPAVEILLSLVFWDEADKAWFKRRFGTMYESLKESWLVQELMQEAMQEAREQEELKLQEVRKEEELKLQEVRKEEELKLQEVRKEGELKLQETRKEAELKLQEVRKEAEEVRKEAELKLQEVELRLKELQREAEVKVLEQEQQHQLQEWRAFLLSFVEERFPNPKVVRLAKGQAAIIDDAKILQNLILKVGLAKTVGEVEHSLLDWSDADEEQS